MSKPKLFLIFYLSITLLMAAVAEKNYTALPDAPPQEFMDTPKEVLYQEFKTLTSELILLSLKVSDYRQTNKELTARIEELAFEMNRLRNELDRLKQQLEEKEK